MSDLIIRKTDIEKFGRKLMKKVYEFLHDDYILTFEEMKVEKEKLENNLVEKYLHMYYNIDSFSYSEKQYEKYTKDLNNKNKHDSILKIMISEIEDENLDIKIIFDVLESIKLEFEIDEDLFVEKKAFIHIYSVFHIYNDYL